MPPRTSEERLRDVELQLEKHRVRGSARGGGKPYVTLTIAAYNTIAPNATNCDYVCTGSADDVKINEAITRITNDAYSGGRIVLLEGIYSLSAPIALADNIEIEGMGWRKTWILAGDAAFTDGWLIQTTAAGFARVANLYLYCQTAHAADIGAIRIDTGAYVDIENIWHEKGDHDTFYLPTLTNGRIRNCYMRQGTANAISGGTWTNVVVQNNVIDTFLTGSAVLVTTPNQVFVRNNKIHRCQGGVIAGYD